MSHNIYERYGTIFEEKWEYRRCRKIAIIEKEPFTCLVRVFFVFVFAVLVSIGSFSSRFHLLLRMMASMKWRNDTRYLRSFFMMEKGRRSFFYRCTAHPQLIGAQRMGM